MKEFLTERNGVICRHCFRTIDLTEIKKKQLPKVIKIISKIVGPPEFFNVKCPHCTNNASYSFRHDVKPIAYSEIKEIEDKKSLDIWKEKYQQVKIDAKTLARELIAEDITPESKDKLNQTDPQNKTKLKEKDNGVYH